MTDIFEAEFKSKPRYNFYSSGSDPLEDLNHNWTSPKWGKNQHDANIVEFRFIICIFSITI